MYHSVKFIFLRALRITVVEKSFSHKKVHIGMILKCACFYINFIGKRDEVKKKQEQGRKIAKEENELEKQHK